MSFERIASPAKRINRGTGTPKTYLIDPNYRSPEVRCCRFCGKYDDDLMKVGKRAYAHKGCFEEKYGPLRKMPRVAGR